MIGQLEQQFYTCQLACLLNFSLSCSTGQTTSHGSSSGASNYQISLTNFDVVGLAVRSGSLVDQMALIATHKTTGEFKVFGPYGGSGGGSGITFGLIQAFYGRSGGGIDHIGAKGNLFG